MKLSYILAKVLKKVRGSAIKNSTIHPTARIESGCNVYKITMGKYSFCGYNCELLNCQIGSFCSIANNVIIGGAMHPINWVSTSPVFYSGRDTIKKKFSEFDRDREKITIIEQDVWIGNNALIKQGVRIGTGAIIGMGSIVTKDVEPYTIVAGSPAIVIKKRFDDEIIKKLLETKWWNLSDEQLELASRNINDPLKFIKLISK